MSAILDSEKSPGNISLLKQAVQIDRQTGARRELYLDNHGDLKMMVEQSLHNGRERTIMYGGIGQPVVTDVSTSEILHTSGNRLRKTLHFTPLQPGIELSLLPYKEKAKLLPWLWLQYGDDYRLKVLYVTNKSPDDHWTQTKRTINLDAESPIETRFRHYNFNYLICDLTSPLCTLLVTDDDHQTISEYTCPSIIPNINIIRLILGDTTYPYINTPLGWDSMLDQVNLQVNILKPCI